MSSTTDRIIAEVPLTKTWLADVIEKKEGVRPKIGTSAALDNSEMGYMSMIRRVDLRFDDDEEDRKLPKSVVLKIASGSKGTNVLDSASGDSTEKLEQNLLEQYMHDTECDYYKVFADLPAKPLRVPTVYATEKTHTRHVAIPVIVMETFENCKVYDICQGFNEQQLFKIVDEIVKLHVFSLTTHEWRKVAPAPEVEGMLLNFHNIIRSVAEKLAETEGLERIKVILKNSFEKNADCMLENAQQYVTGKRDSVLCHGDLWSPQILWDHDDNIAGIIDWQTSHVGSPMEDIQHMLSTCTSAENRERLTRPLLDYYFEKLTEGLEAKGAKMPWTRDQIEEEYNARLLDSCLLTIFANGFWANSPVLQTDGKPDAARILESFSRCKSFIDHTISTLNLN